MISNLLIGRSLSLVLVVFLLCSSSLKAADSVDVTTDLPGENMAKLFHNSLGNQIAKSTFADPVLSVALRQVMCTPDSRLNNLLQYPLSPLQSIVIKEFYRQNYAHLLLYPEDLDYHALWLNTLDYHAALLNTLFNVERKSMAIVQAILKDQINQLKLGSPFYWPTSSDKLRAQSLIKATNNQLNAWNIQGHVNLPSGRTAFLNGSSSHIFTLNPAYRQLVDISQNGWAPSLNWDSSRGDLGTRQTTSAPEDQATVQPDQLGESTAQPDQPGQSSMEDYQMTDSYNDINASLLSTEQASDQAMQQYNEDADSKGITAGLKGTAQENVVLTQHMNDLEHQAVSSDIKILATGVASGALIMVGGIALHSLAFHSFTPFHQVSHTAVSSSHNLLPVHANSFPSAGLHSHILGAPTIGGSFDGAAGQTLFSF